MSGVRGPIKSMGKVVTHIKVNGTPTPIKVTPLQLENDWSKNKHNNRKQVNGKTTKSTKRRKNNIFTNNGYRILFRICKAYKVSYTLTEVTKDNVWHEIKIEIPGLNITASSSGDKKRTVKRRITFALHHEYCKQLYKE